MTTTAATTKTPQQRGRANRNKGQAAERALAIYLRPWWPEARRAVVTGTAVTGGDGVTREVPDPGDVAGVPGVIWSVKDCGAEYIDRWLDELDEMAHLTGDTLALRYLVHKRRGTSPGRWWCWQRHSQLVAPGDGLRRLGLEYPVRCELRHAVLTLQFRGYTDVRDVAS